MTAADLHTQPRQHLPAIDHPVSHRKGEHAIAPDSRIEVVALEIASAIAAQTPSDLDGLAPKAYVVGGWNRDRIMGRASNDIDIEAFGIDPHNLVQALTALGYHVLKPERVSSTPYKVILGEDGYIDITLAMKQHTHTDGKATLTLDPYLSVSEAAQRRDFTVNAIYYDQLNQAYVDPFDGITDIANGVLRLVPGLDRYTINPQIPLRACRQAAQLNMMIEDASAREIEAAVAAGLVSRCSPVELTKEFQKLLLGSPTPSVGLRIADRLGVLQAVFPEISALKGVPQDPRHHPEGSVFEHTMMVVDAAARLTSHLPEKERFKVLLAALFHDVGKIDTTKISTVGGVERISAHAHEQSSAEICRTALKRLDLSHSTRNQVLKMVVHHMKPFELEGTSTPGTAQFDNRVRQLVRAVHPASFDSYIGLCRADRLGRATDPESDPRIQTLDAMERSAHENGFVTDPTNCLLTGATIREMGFLDQETPFRAIITETEVARDRGAIDSVDLAKKFALIKFGLTTSQVEAAGIVSPAIKGGFYKAYKAAVKEDVIKTLADARAFLEAASREFSLSS